MKLWTLCCGLGLLARFAQGVDLASASAVSASAFGHSFVASFSSDGHHIVFLSHAPNLTTNRGRSPHLDVFVRDLILNETILVSTSQNSSSGGNANSASPAVSSNGLLVAFSSEASNLVPDDTNAASDVFLRDLTSGITRPVSATTSGGVPVNPFPSTNAPLSSNPKITPNGRFVLFDSIASELSTVPDTNGKRDIFVRDLANAATTLVSINSAGDGPGNGDSHSGVISPDGRFVAFISKATNLAAGNTNINGDVYVRDVQSASTIWVSSNVVAHFSGSQGGYQCFNPRLSDTGQQVVFLARPQSQTNPVLVAHVDLSTGQSSVLTSNSLYSSQPIISSDGQQVAYESGGRLYIWQAAAESNVLISARTDNSGPSSARAHTPFATPDFSRVGFISAGTDLVPGATSSVSRIYVRNVAENSTAIASLGMGGQVNQKAVEATMPAITADGVRVLFDSLDNDLAPNDHNDSYDVFVRDLAQNETLLISRAHAQRPSATTAMAGMLSSQCLSSNGSYIFFGSLDRPEFAGDRNRKEDLFLHHAPSGELRLVTESAPGQTSTNFGYRYGTISGDGQRVALARFPSSGGLTYGVQQVLYMNLETNVWRQVAEGGVSFPPLDPKPRISVSGRYILFESMGAVVAYGNPSGRNVFLYNVESRTNQLVSIRNSNSGSHPGPSSFPLLSPDEIWVGFISEDRTLTADQPPTVRNLYARNLAAYSTILISRGQSDARAWGSSSSFSFSGNSRFAAYASANRHLCIYDFRNGKVRVAASNVANPVLNSDGTLVLYEVPPSIGAATNLTLLDLRSGASHLISQSSSGAPADGHCYAAKISRNDRYIVFASRASNLAANDNNQATDIFVRDRFTARTFLVSATGAGASSGAGPSVNPVMAPDGRTVAFESFAPDLAAGDYNERRDIYLVRLGTADSDNDGIDDDWELAYFNGLSRDGAGDYDADGQTDLQEFMAGSDPTNAGSVLRVITVSRAGTETIVFWASIPGRRYRVQYKADLNTAGWTDVAGDVVAQADTAAKVHEAASSPDGFYRVILLQ